MYTRRNVLRAGAGAGLALAASTAGAGAVALGAPGAAVPDADWTGLGARLRGDLVLPADADYELAKQNQLAEFDAVHPRGLPVLRQAVLADRAEPDRHGVGRRPPARPAPLPAPHVRRRRRQHRRPGRHRLPTPLRQLHRRLHHPARPADAPRGRAGRDRVRGDRRSAAESAGRRRVRQLSRLRSARLGDPVLRRQLPAAAVRQAPRRPPELLPAPPLHRQHHAVAPHTQTEEN